MKRWLRRFALHGDVWLRYLDLGVLICPWFLEPIFVTACAASFYALCVPQRRALLANMAVLFPGENGWQRHVRAFRVVRDFAWVLTDSARVRSGDDVIDWEVEGVEYLNQLGAHPGGALILTAHMGSYDLAGQLFADRLQRPLHIVRVPERHAESQTYAADARHSHPSGQFIVHYNQPGNMLAVELTRLLADGEVVAIQGDRILFDVAPENLDFCEGYQWRLPKGPFLLGVVSRCPVFPLFIARVGWRRYRITAGPPFECPEGRFDKNDWRQRMASWWSTQLAAAVRTHWRQWFVFEPAFVAKPEPTP